MNPIPRGMPFTAAAALAAVAFAMGALGGAWFTKSRQAATPATPAGDGARASETPVAAPDPLVPASPADTASALAAKLAAAEKEIVTLRGRIAEFERSAPGKKSDEEKIAVAKEMMECLRKGRSNAEAMRQLFKLLAEIDPAMAPYFLERLADPAETADKDPLCDLAIGSGGPVVADWLLAKLTDTGTPNDMRERILYVLGGGSRKLFPSLNVPVQGRLADTAFQYAATGDTRERQAGAGLLGAVDTTESRTVLYRLAATDTEFRVREEAIHSLGTAGDRETLVWLDTFQTTIRDLEPWEKEKLQAAVDGAREKLAKKFP